MLALACPLSAAELAVPSAHAHFRGAANCGPCGCLSVVFDYHRELRSTYGLVFDPRNYDATEPHYYFGPIRAYPRYFINGEPLYAGSC